MSGRPDHRRSNEGRKWVDPAGPILVPRTVEIGALQIVWHLRPRRSERWVDCGRHHGLQTGRTARHRPGRAIIRRVSAKYFAAWMSRSTRRPSARRRGWHHHHRSYIASEPDDLACWIAAIGLTIIRLGRGRAALAVAACWATGGGAAGDLHRDPADEGRDRPRWRSRPTATTRGQSRMPCGSDGSPPCTSRRRTARSSACC